MVRTKLFFDVEDKEYFSRLKQYIDANYSPYFEITDNTDGVCIVSDYINRRNRKGIFLIKEDKGDVSKYKSAFEICSALMTANSFEEGDSIYNKKSVILKICVTSASGGAGKSTVSQAMSCSLAKAGKKVLYINMNPFASYEHIFTESDKNSFTRLRYYIKIRDKNISGRIKSLSARSEDRRVDYIVNKLPSADGFITKDEVKWLISEIDRNCPYDAIVFDIPSYPGSGHIELMKYADKTYLLYSEKSDLKYEEYLRYLQFEGISDIECVANFSEDVENAIPRADGIFTAYPEDFWMAIGRLCKIDGENYEKDN